jgi:hypothetical protein
MNQMLLGAAFFTLVAGMSMISGFAATLMAAKRKDSAMFDKVMWVIICCLTNYLAETYLYLVYASFFHNLKCYVVETKSGPMMMVKHFFLQNQLLSCILRLY